jgi:uncharacterized membrane protein
MPDKNRRIEILSGPTARGFETGVGLGIIWAIVGPIFELIWRVLWAVFGAVFGTIWRSLMRWEKYDVDHPTFSLAVLTAIYTGAFAYIPLSIVKSLIVGDGQSSAWGALHAWQWIVLIIVGAVSFSALIRPGRALSLWTMERKRLRQYGKRY